MLSQRMMSIGRTGTLFLMLSLLPIVVRAAEVADGGGFFSPDAVAAAKQSIQELEKKFGHQIRVETFASVPLGQAEAVSKMDAKQRDAFFSKWVHERAEATGSRGIFVLICREPSHFNLWAGTPIQRAGFGPAQAKPVREAALARLKAKEYDKALSEIVTQLSTTFSTLKSNSSKSNSTTTKSPRAAESSKHISQNVPAPPNRTPTHSGPSTATPGSNWTGVLVILMFVIGGIAVVSLIGRMFGGGRSYSPGGYGTNGPGYGGGGGGFMSSLMGGIFGSMAGHWMYDQFTGHRAFGGEPHSQGDFSPSNHTSESSGFDSGSGDSDSGFSGGTDFGGGDFSDNNSGGGGSDFDSGGDF
jgi:TLP18.3/Psb32/MOLO-1 phosphatase superfamily protein